MLSRKELKALYAVNNFVSNAIKEMHPIDIVTDKEKEAFLIFNQLIHKEQKALTRSINALKVVTDSSINEWYGKESISKIARRFKVSHSWMEKRISAMRITGTLKQLEGMRT